MKTDLQLQQDIIAELTWEPSVNAAQIGVEVKDGVVTLAGHVNSYSEKWRAERVAQRIAVDLVLRLADIARTAENVLEWMTYAPRDSVKVMVEGGWITLSGEVDWEYQRWAAVKGVSHLMGVTGVSDHMAIKPQASNLTVKSGIEAALKRRAQTDAQNITVEAFGDRVTLAGTVHSWSERDLAERSAWGAPGVRSVINNMTIA